MLLAGTVTSVSLETELLAEIKRQAFKNNQSASQWIVDAAKRKLEADKPKSASKALAA
jgi:metal-responsive CopG/Arc/MetJ family transcriptional regulator